MQMADVQPVHVNGNVNVTSPIGRVSTPTIRGNESTNSNIKYYHDHNLFSLATLAFLPLLLCSLALKHEGRQCKQWSIFRLSMANRPFQPRTPMDSP